MSRGANVETRGVTVDGRGVQIGTVGGGGGVTEVLTWDGETEWAESLDRPGMVYDEVADHAGGEGNAVHSGYYHGSLVRGLVGYWPLDEGSGSTATDETELGIDGTINGATYVGSGQVGGDMLSFDGTDDNVDFGTTEQLFLNDEFSIAGFMNVDTEQTRNTLIARPGIRTTKTNWGLGAGGGQFFCRIGTDGSSDNVSGGTVNTGTWYHYAMTVTLDQLVGYLDGAVIGTQSRTTGDLVESAPAFIGQTDTSSLGGSADSNNPADIDDVRIYDRALSQPEIETLAGRTATSPVTAGNTL